MLKCETETLKSSRFMGTVYLYILSQYCSYVHVNAEQVNEYMCQVIQLTHYREGRRNEDINPLAGNCAHSRLVFMIGLFILNSCIIWIPISFQLAGPSYVALRQGEMGLN